MNPSYTIRILLIEDSEGDALLTKMAFDTLHTETHITCANTGQKALEMLAQQGIYEGVPLPDLILLDLNMPDMSGAEILQSIKDKEHMRHIPVITLSGSSSPQEIKKMYALLASGYILKPLDTDSFIATAQAIETFWFNTNMLSSRVA